MDIKFFRLALYGFMLLFLTSCTSYKTAKVVPDAMLNDLTPAFNAGNYDSKLDGVIVLMDASSSMAETYQGYRKFDIAKTFLDRMNRTLPPIPAISGIRTFGHAPELSRKNTELFYGMAPYDRAQIGQVISDVKPPGGPTPMADAINAAQKDLEKISGNKAVIIVSDGKDLDDRPVAAARELNASLGGGICIYTVLVGDDDGGKAVMDNIAATSSCGYMVSAYETKKPNEVTKYVTDVFLVKSETTVDNGMGLGYAKADITTTLTNVHFNFDEYTLTPKGKAILDQHVEALTMEPDVSLIIQGHTSAKGTLDYNQVLSEKRAQTVKDYLVNSGKINPDRLTTVGYGETKPFIIESDPMDKYSHEAKSNMRVVFEVLQK